MRRPVQQPHKPDFNVMEEGYKWLSNVSRYSIDIRSVDVTIDPGNVLPNTSIEQNITVKGLKVGDYYFRFAQAYDNSRLYGWGDPG